MPKLPKERNIQNSLNLVEQAFQSTIDPLKRHGAPILLGTPEARAASDRLWYFETDLIDLVHQQTMQLYHPYVRHYFLRPDNASREPLRLLHRGLEVGVKRRLKACDLPVLAAVWEGQEKNWPLRRTQKLLQEQGWIRPMSRQAFDKRVKRIKAAFARGAGPYFNAVAMPKLEDVPQYISDAWKKAEANLRELRNSPENRKELDDYIQERRERLASHFGQKSKQ